MAEGRQTVAGAYQKIEDHEVLCAERYRGINEKLGLLIKGVIGLVVGLLAWMAVQLYTLEPLRIQAAATAHAPAQAVVVNAPPARP